MVSKCANPGCPAPFHYLREGKVFRIQVEPARVEHFWLCGPCASTMTLVVENGKVVTVPREHGQFQHAAAS